MITFDRILPVTAEVLIANRAALARLDWLLINRDLNGKVRLVAPEAAQADDSLRRSLDKVAVALTGQLGPHAYPPEAAILYEVSRQTACQDAVAYLLDGFDKVWLADRLASEGDWAKISPEAHAAPRVVFFSITGGVGRSTALAATAWSLAQAGKRVLVLDLNLASPGLSSGLLPRERQPQFGITDWLVEDLADNTGEVLDNMIATASVSHDGEIYVVPAHGIEPGEYVAKLGRVWMPKMPLGGAREPWSQRLKRLLQILEERIDPDAVLIDTPAGIDDAASACVMGLEAALILLFALEGRQTWNGYRALFEHWRRSGAARSIRERLQIVAGMVPELDRAAYLVDLREQAYEMFIESLYDEIAPPLPDSAGPAAGSKGHCRVGDVADGWSFDEADRTAPHYPWAVSWNRNFAPLHCLEGRLAVLKPAQVQLIFGPLIDGIKGHLQQTGNLPS